MERDIALPARKILRHKKPTPIFRQRPAAAAMALMYNIIHYYAYTVLRCIIMYKREKPDNFIKNREKVKLPYITCLGYQRYTSEFILSDSRMELKEFPQFLPFPSSFLFSFRLRIDDAEISGEKEALKFRGAG